MLIVEGLELRPEAFRRQVRSLRYLPEDRELNLAQWGLEGLMMGKPTKLYHGTTRLFRKFDLKQSRDELVKDYYGSGIFLTPSRRVAADYAYANRNKGFPKDVIDKLKRKNKNAGAFLQALYDEGDRAWDTYGEKHGIVTAVEWDQHLGGLDANTIGDVAGYILGSKVKPLSSGGGDFSLFNYTAIGLPDYVYDNLEELGIDSKPYRPKVYTVMATVRNPLVTQSQAKARGARASGYDSVIYYGPFLVQDVPEVAVFDPKKVRITKIDVL
jgi:hypothetical protein